MHRVRTTPLLVLLLSAIAFAGSPALAQTAVVPAVSTRVGVDGAAVVAVLPYGASFDARTLLRVRKGEEVLGESAFSTFDRTASVLDLALAPGASASYTAAVVRDGVEGERSSVVVATVPDRPLPESGPYDAVVRTGALGGVSDPAAYRASPGRLQVMAAGPDGGTQAVVRWSRELAPGTYVSRYGAPAEVSVDHISCRDGVEEVRVTEAAVRADGTPLVLTLDWDVRCPEDGTEHGGQVRWHSRDPYASASLSAVDLPATRVGTTVRREAAYRNRGPRPLAVGAPWVTGFGARSFSVAGSTCPAVLAPGGACTVLVDVVPQAVDYQHATLVVPDDTVLGRTTASLRVLGSDLPLAPDAPVVGVAVDRAQVTWNDGRSWPYDWIRGYDVWRSAPDGSGRVKVGSVSEHDRREVTDTGVRSGSTYAYSVTTRNTTGSSEPSARTLVTIPAQELITDDLGGWRRLSGPGAPGVLDRAAGSSSHGPPAVSPDGRALAFASVGDDAGSPTGVFVSAPDLSGRRRLTTGPHRPLGFTRDGRTVLLVEQPYGGPGTLLRVASAGGTPQPVPGGTQVVGGSVVDERRAVVVVEEGGLRHLALLDLVTGARTRLAGTDGAQNAVTSRDGRSLAWTDVETQEGRTVTSIRVGPLTGPHRTLSTGGHWPRVTDWSLDGSSLYGSHMPDDWSGHVTAQFFLDGSPSVTWRSGQGGVLRYKDLVAPVLRRTVTPARATVAPAVRTSWSATDALSGVGGHQVRTRRARYDGDLGAYSAVTAAGAATTVTQLSPGYDTCTEVRSLDRHGNASPWTASCTSRPLDDRSLRASTGWTRTTATGTYAGTVSTARRAGATLTLPTSRAVRGWLVATTCSTCGSVQVLVGGRLLGTVSLRSSTTKRQALLPLPGAGTLRTGSVVLRTTSSAQVVVDGLALARQP